MLTRRQWLKLSALLGVQASGALGCQGPPDESFVYAAVFEVTRGGALVSLFAPGSQLLRIRVLTRGGELVQSHELIPDQESGLALLELRDLLPYSHYEVEVQADEDSPAGRYHFRTAPPSQLEVPLLFAYSADIDVAPQNRSPIFDSMLDAEPEFFLSLGDWPYADDFPGAESAQDYYERHLIARGSGLVQRLLHELPIYAIWDDHEVRNNWDARFREEEAERIEAGIEAWDQWFPLRGKERYRSVRWGKHLEIFILDTRLYRSANLDVDDENKTMLGAEQFQWLTEALLESDATFKCIATSVPLDFGMPEDSWAVFTFERQRLWEFITSQRIQTVVFLTADQHFFCPHHFANGLKEVQVGPLARERFKVLPPQQDEELMRFNDLNYGEVQVQHRPEPLLTIRGRDRHGVELYSESIRPGIGRLRIESAKPRPFITEGAHVFRGTTPAEFPYAAVGPYRIIWQDTGEPGRQGELLPDQELVLRE